MKANRRAQKPDGTVGPSASRSPFAEGSIPLPRPRLLAPHSLLLLLAIGLIPTPAPAQEVRGRLVSVDGEAVPWALVRLVAEDGSELMTVVSSTSGAFNLRSANPGTFRVKAERIGYAATVSEPMSLTRDEPLTLVLTAVDSPIELPVLEVETESFCGLGRRAGPTLLAVWTEVRKALELQTETNESGAYDFEGEQYKFVVDRMGRPVDDELAAEQTEKVRFSGSSGFYAIDPEVLAEQGFRTTTPENDREYYAPDARTLLSESFQSGHCYSVRRDEDRLGLRFEPMYLSDHKVDVDGALWLDEESGELQTIEFEYVSGGIPGYQLDGGYLEFERLPEGAWIVRRWWLREPVYSPGANMRQRRMSPLLEAGGRILSVSKRPVTPEPAPERVEPSADLLGVPREPLRVIEPAGGVGARGFAEVERARQLFAEGRPDEAFAVMRTACASGDSLALEALWTDFRGLATSNELAEWNGRPPTTRCAFLGTMIAERAMRAGVSNEARLAQHYERLDRARRDWGLDEPRVQTGAAELYGRHPELEYDDRGLIFVRMGVPDEVAFAIAGQDSAMGNRIEGWRYDRPEGPRVFFFAPVTRVGIGLADYRLLDAAWRALGRWSAISEIDFVFPTGLDTITAASFPGLPPLVYLYLSFQGLDPIYATRAYRMRSFEGTALMHELSRDRQETLADVAFAVDSVPDAPDLSPSLSFIWERLRFLDPSSTETVVWFLATARAGDLEERAAEDRSSVYRVQLSATVQRGTAVTADSSLTEVRPDRSLDDDDAVVARLPVSVGPGSYPFTLILRDGNDAERASGNWTRGSVTGMRPSNLPEISDLAVAADSGGTWTRDGVTFLAVSPSHVTKPDGELHLYFEVYGLPGGSRYDVEIRAVPERDAEQVWAVEAGTLAYRASFGSEMPVSSEISPHHLRLDLSDTPEGAYVLGVRVTDTESGLQSLPVTTPVIRAR